MTTRRQMAEMAAIQERVIETLHDSGEVRIANRLNRCMAARVGRRSADGRPWTCRSAGCSWCRGTLIRRWWAGMERWITTDSDPVSLAVLPLHHEPCGVRTAVARL